MKENKEIYILVEYIKLSPNRTKIIKALNEDNLKPSEIARKSKIHINSVSKGLKQLREKEIVYLLNPEAKRGRIYELTNKGKEVAKEL